MTNYTIIKNNFCLPLWFFYIVILLIHIASSLAQEPQLLPDKQNRREIILKINQLLKDHYIFPDSAAQYGDKLLRTLESGEYDTLQDASTFAKAVTGDLQKITNDKHLKFRLIEPSDVGEEKEGSLHHPVRLFRLGQKEHLGFYRLDWLEGNIGYLDLRRFYSPTVAKEMLVNAMNFLSGANAIIIDLRKNQGGDLDPVFSSYFLNYPTRLSSIYYREGDFTQETGTIEKIEGQRMTDIPLFLLIGKETFSAAEAFAYDLKVLKRAILVGDSTKGGAHSVDLYKIADRFEIYISTSRFINPVTKTNWEGSGVIPDILVPAESALDTVMVLARKAAKEYGQIKDKDLKETVENMQRQLDRAEQLFQTGNDEPATTVLDSAFQTGTRANLINEFFVEVLAYDYLSGPSEKMQMAILKKNIELFPESYNPYLLLAMTYEEQGKEESAIKYFEKVLELDPNNSVAIAMLKKLRK